MKDKQKLKNEEFQLKKSNIKPGIEHKSAWLKVSQYSGDWENKCKICEIGQVTVENEAKNPDGMCQSCRERQSGGFDINGYKFYLAHAASPDGRQTFAIMDDETNEPAMTLNTNFKQKVSLRQNEFAASDEPGVLEMVNKLLEIGILKDMNEDIQIDNKKTGVIRHFPIYKVVTPVREISKGE